MKVALIYPSKRADVSQMPLGLGYLASYVLRENDDIEVEVLDTGIASEKELKAFCNCRYDIVGFSVTSRGYNEAVELAKSFKEADKSIFIAFGGPHVTLLREQSIQGPVIDFGIYGEGELTLNELLQVLKESNMERQLEALSKIKGLIYQNGAHAVVNPPRELIRNLDRLPFPAYHLFPMDRYPGKYPMITSRGCPFRCVFCAASRAWNGKWRARTAENVVDEVEFVLKHYATRPIDFHDAAFNVNIKRVHDICDTFIRRKVRIPWGIRGFRADIIDTETSRIMNKAGCTQVAVGIESANPEMLIHIRKQETIEDIDKGINILRGAGIDVLGEFMIGNPGETLETAKESIAYVKNSNLSEAVFGSAVPFPGTALWDYVNEHGTFLVEPDCTKFEEVYPRVIFETPEFNREDRLQAIRLTKAAGLMRDRGPEKKSGYWSLHDIAHRLWYEFAYKHLPRSISYQLHFFLRKCRAILKGRMCRSKSG